MASLGKSNFSKLMSVLLSVIMVLSTMTFTLPVKVKAESTVLWEENFNFELGEGGEYYDISTLRPDWVATIVDSDNDSYGEGTGTFVTNSATSPITWSDVATLRGPRVEFDGDRVILKELRNTWNGGSKAELVIPMTFNTDDGKHPKEGYTVFEFDYYSDTPFVKGRSNEWGVQDLTLFHNSAVRHYARIGITTTNGIQDLIDSPVKPNDPEAGTTSYKEAYALSGYYDSFVAGTNKNNIRQGTDLAGKPVKMQIIYDLENMKYMISATVDGEKSFRGNTWMDIPGTVIGHVTEPYAPDIDNFINRVKLQASEEYVSSSGESVASYDNMKYTHYTVLPEFLSSSVEDGDTDVPVSGTIDLEFSEDIDETSINGITLKAGNTEADVAVAMDGTDKVTVTYSGLSGNVDYTLTVPETVTNLGGLPISAKQEITFKTEQTVPEVTSVTPANDAKDQLLTVTPQVAFSEAVDEETIDNITLSSLYGNVELSRALSADGKTVTLTPSLALDADTTYTVTVPVTVKSLGGIALAEEFTSTFKTAMGGTILWSEDFTGLTNDNVGQLRDTWSGNTPHNPGYATPVQHNIAAGGDWSLADTEYTSKIIFNENVTLEDSQSTEWGSTCPVLYIPLDLSQTTPSSGYLVFSYDYVANTLARRGGNAISLRDLVLECAGATKTYAEVSVSSTYGIQDLYAAGADMTNETYLNNIRGTEDITGKTVRMQIVYDLAGKKYMISATVDGEKNYSNSDWIAITDEMVGTAYAQGGQYFINRVVLRQDELNWGGSGSASATYDNFMYVHYTTLPNFVSHSIADTSNVNVAGSFDLTFDSALDTASINAISLKAKNSDTAEEIELTMKNSKTVTVTYSGLANSADYTLTIPVTVTNRAGLPISVPQTIEFTTNANVAPEITSSTVENNATGVPLNKVLQLTFSTALDPETVENITLKKANDSTNYITDYILSENNTVVTLYHNVLTSNTQYTLDIPATVKSSAGIPATGSYTFTTGTYNADGSAWSQNFDAIDALSGDALDTYMAENHSGWTAQIGTGWTARPAADGYYYGQYGNTVFALNNATTGFKWSEAPTKYREMEVFTGKESTDKVTGYDAGSIDFVNGRIKLGIPSRKAHGGPETFVKIPVTNVSVAGKDYAVFEFDYYSDKMPYRNALQAGFSDGDITLRNASNQRIARINIGTTFGISDILTSSDYNKDNVSLDTVGDEANIIAPPTGLLSTIIHFRIIYDIEHGTYKISATPDGGATMTRTVDDSEWIALPDGVAVDGFSQVYLSIEDRLNGSSATEQTFAEYDNIKITTVEGNPAIVKSSLDGITEPIPVSSELKLYFTEAMDEDTLSEITLTSTGGAVTLTPELSDDGKVATLNHPALAINTNYTLTVPVSVTSALGIPMAEAKTYEFTTDGTAAPEVTAATIINGASNITLDKLLSVTFNQAMAPATASGITLKKQDSDVNLITGYEWSNGDTVVKLFHETMEANATYILEIPNTVVSASSGLPVYASYTFTTGDFATEVIWSENFDNLTNADVATERTGWTAQVMTREALSVGAAVTNNTYSTSGSYTWDQMDDYANKIKLQNNKFGIIRQAGHSHGAVLQTATIPVSTSSTPTSGYAVFEFDYLSTKLPTKGNTNFYTNDVVLTNNKNSAPIFKLSISSNYGVQDTLNPDAAQTGLAFATLSAEPYVNNICSADGIVGKNLHFQVIYDVENLKYMLSVTPEGGTRIIRNSGWIDLPSDVTAIDFKQLTFALKSGNSGGSGLAGNTWYDNIKIWETSELPEIITSTVEGNPEVKVDHDIVLRFTKQMNLASLKNITLVANETSVAVTPLLSNGGRTVVISHPELATDATYTLTVPATVTSELGLPVAATSYQFTTAGAVGDVAIDSATVSDGAKNIPVDRELTINFTGAVTEASASSITLTKQGEDTNLITGYTVNGTSVTLAHDNFDLSETYVLIVPAAVKSEATGLGITQPSVYTFTTLGEADVDVWFAENFDGRTAGDAEWGVTIASPVTADGTVNTSSSASYTLKNHYTWADAATAYAVNGVKDGPEFADGRLVINKNATGWHSANVVTVTMPFAFGDAPQKGYAVFEYDYFTTAMALRGQAIEWNLGDVRLTNSDGAVIARLQMSKTNGIQDILNPTNGSSNLTYSQVSGSYKNNICEATDMENKTLHFKVVYDVENSKYLVTMTPEGGATVVSSRGWQSLPANTKINFASAVFELKEYPQGDMHPVNSQYDNVKIAYVSDNPVLLSTSVDNSPELAVNGEITLTFDEPVYGASLLNATIIAEGESESVEITGVELSGDGKTATLKHKHFGTSKTYTLTVPETVMSANGVPMGVECQRTFTTDDVAGPTVSATITNNATDIPLNKEIAIQLSEAIDESTISGITLVVKDGDGTNLLGAYELSEEGKKVTFAHENFAMNTDYVLTVPETVKGVSGITVEETVYNFKTTDAKVTATLNATGTAVNKNTQLALTFAEPITDTNIGNVKLSTGGQDVAITPALDQTGTVLSLGNGTLNGSTTYTVTIPEGLVAVSGVPVEAKTFEFTTGASFAISSYSGFANGGTSEIARTITLTFSEAVSLESLSNITLAETESGETVDLQISLSADNKTATLRHYALDYETNYTLTVPVTVTSQTGGSLDAEQVYTFTTKAYSTILWQEDFTAPWNGKEAGVQFGGYYENDWQMYVSGEGYREDINSMQISEDGKLTYIKEQNASNGAKQIFAKKNLYNVPNEGVIQLDFDYTISAPYEGYAGDPFIAVNNTKDEQILSISSGSLYYGFYVTPQQAGANHVGVNALSWAQGYASDDRNYKFVNDGVYSFNSSDLVKSMADGGVIHGTVLIDFDNKTYQVKLVTDEITMYTPINTFEFIDGLTNTQVGSIGLYAICHPSSEYGTTVTSTFDNLELKIVEDKVAPEIIESTVGETDEGIVENFVFKTDVEINKVVVQDATLTKADGTPVNLSSITVSDDLKTVTIAHDKLELGTEYTLTLPLVSMSGGVNTEEITFTTVPETTWGSNVLWHEDFNNGKPTGFDGSAGYGTGSAEIKALNKLEFVNGKLSLTKQQQNNDLNSNNIQIRAIPIGLAATDLPETGYVSFEFEYDQSGPMNNDWVQSFKIQDANGKIITALGFSRPRDWFADVTRVGNGSAGDKIVESQVAIDNGLKVQVLYDVEARTYMVYYTPKGGTKAVAQTGPHALADGTEISFKQISIQIGTHSDNTYSDSVVLDFDNFAVATYDKINVTGTNVADTDVPVDQEITLTFDAAMDEDYINNITLTPAEGEAIEINATLSEDGKTVTFNNAELEMSTTYTISVVKDTVFGASGAPVTAYTKTFTTEKPPVVVPEVTARSLTDGEQNVGIIEVPTYTFSTPMDANSLSNITIAPTEGGDNVVLTPELSDDGLTVSLKHSANFAYNTQYTITLPASVMSSTEGALTPETLTFTTIAEAQFPEGVLWSETFDNGLPTGSSITLTNPHEQDKIEYKNGKLIITRSRTADITGGKGVNGTIPISGVTVPETGYIAFEFDYKQTGTINQTPYDNITIRNSANAGIAALRFGDPGRYLGVPQTIGTNWGTSSKVADMTALDGQQLHIQILYDIEAGTYMIYYTPENGVKTPSMTGPFNIPADLSFAKVILNIKTYISSGSASDIPSVMEFDNFAVVAYDDPEIPAAPAFASITPADGAEDVLVDSDIAVTFDSKIDEATITGVKLFDGATEITAVTRSLSADGKTVTINPDADLEEGKTYTVKITTDVKGANTIAFAEEVTKTFTTKRTIIPPVATAFTPAKNATKVAVDTNVTVTFDMALDENTISGITLSSQSGNVEVAHSLSADGLTVTLDPVSNLDYETVYTITVPVTVASTLGGTVATPVTSTFTTKLAPITQGTIWEEKFDVLPTDIEDGETFGILNDTNGASGWNFGVGGGETYFTENNYFKYNSNVLQLTREQNVTGDLTASRSFDRAPETGIVEVEFDFTMDKPMLSGNGTRAFFSIKNTADEYMFAMSFANATWGVVNSTTSTTGNNISMGSAPASVYFVNTADGTTRLTGTEYTNKFANGETSHITVTFDLDEETYIAQIETSDGSVYATSGAFIDGLTSKEIGQVVLQSYAWPGKSEEGTVTTTYDNIKVSVPEAVVPVVESTDITHSIVKAPTITFNTQIKASSLAGITLMNGVTPIEITPELSADGKTLTIAHADPFPYGATLTLTLPNTIKSTTNGTFEGKTYTITTIEEATLKEGTIWSENFDLFDANETAPTGWSTGVWYNNVSYTSWKDVTANETSIKVVDGKLILSKQQEWTGTHDNINLTIPFTDIPTITKDYVSIEFDVKQVNAWEGTTYHKHMTVHNNSSQKLAELGFGNATYGLADYTDANPGAESNRRNIALMTEYVGKDMHVEILFDMVNNTRTYFYTVDGVRKMARGGAASVDGKTLDLKSVQFGITCGAKAGADPVVFEFDNFAVVEYDTNPTVTCALDGLDQVDVDTPIELVFSEAMDIDDMGNVTLKPAAGGDAIALTPSTEDNLTFTFAHEDLIAGTEYVVTVPTGIMSLAGNPVSAKTFTFTVKYPEIADVDYALAVKTDKDIYNAGETVTANIVATSENAFNSFGFTLDYDKEALQLTGVTSTLGNIDFNVSTGVVAFGGTQDIELNTDGVVVATATFTVLDATGEKTIALTNAEMTPSGYDGNKAPEVTPDTFNVYCIKVAFAAGEGVTLSEGAKTAYVKYGTSTLYTDTTYETEYTIPTATAIAGDGYQLISADKYWYNGAEYFTADDIKGKSYTASVTYTATAVKKFTVTVAAGTNGTFAQDATTSFEVDGGTKLGALGLPVATPNAGYVFTGWKVGDTEEIITPAQVAEYAVTGNLALVAQYANGEYNFTAPEFANGSITALNGVTNDKVTYGTDVTFQVTTDADCVVKTVNYTINGVPHTLTPDQFGTYTIAGTDLVADVTLEVVVLKYHTVTFTAGEGTIVSEATAYVISGSAGMYTSLDALKAQGTPDFVIPTPAAQTGYRLAEDTAEEPLWTDGVNGVMTSEFAQKSFTDDVTYEAVAVQQFTVTFTSSAHITFAENAITSVKVDAGKKVTAVPELVFVPGYVLKEWQLNGEAVTPVDVEINEDTEFVVVEELGKYAVTFAKPDGVTVITDSLDNEGKAEFDTNVQFTLQENGVVIKSVTYQVQGSVVKDVPIVNGTYIIPGSDIVAPVTVTIVTNNVYTVTFEADENGTIEGQTSAVVVSGEKLEESQIPTPKGNTGYIFAGWINAETEAEVTLEEVITDDVTYKAVFVLATREIRLPEGVTFDYETGNDVAQYGKDLIFTVASENSVVTHVYYTVGDGEPVELIAENGVYTIDGDLITDDIEITVTEIEGAEATVLDVTYNLSQTSDMKMFILETEQLADKHYVFAGENASSIFWSDKYNAYVAWVADGTTVESLVAGMSVADGAAEVILSGDVNGDGRISAADAGIINDCLHQQREAALTHKQLFAMDIESGNNNEGYQKVTTGDITAILIEAVK